MTSYPAAVLWDMDGTLVDTEPVWIASEQQLVRDYGRGHWSTEEAEAMVGQALTKSAQVLQEQGGVRLSIQEIVDHLIARVQAALREQTPWQPGAYELLEQLAQAQVPCALVTMSYRTLADEMLLNAPSGLFKAVVTGDEVERGKPDPFPYQFAAKQLGVEVEKCVAIEDSLPGVASAEASGARVLAIQHLIEIPENSGRSRTDSLEKITMADLLKISEGNVIDHLKSDQ